MRVDDGGYGRVDVSAVRAAAARQAARVTAGIEDIAAYREAQVVDVSHREVLGPLLPGSGVSGLVMHDGTVIASWGDPSVPEMLFSATKSLVSLVAGLAFDDGLLDPYTAVLDTVSHPALTAAGIDGITWHHLLCQSSQWDGELWGIPAAADAQSGGRPAGLPGSGFAYNDVRVNLLCLALTVLWRRPLGDILRERVMDPLGATSSWRWHGYRNSIVDLDGDQVPVVSGGAHWGGGMIMSAGDLALVGELYRGQGQRGGRRLVSAEWIRRSWEPGEHNPDYGYLWWRNDHGRVQPAAPTTGRCARGNLGRHLLWIDPARDLVIASHWGDEIGLLLADVSAAVVPTQA
jgi:CubicO group peptidase (beta-lactamase class C family)